MIQENPCGFNGHYFLILEDPRIQKFVPYGFNVRFRPQLPFGHHHEEDQSNRICKTLSLMDITKNRGTRYRAAIHHRLYQKSEPINSVAKALYIRTNCNGQITGSSSIGLKKTYNQR